MFSTFARLGAIAHLHLPLVLVVTVIFVEAFDCGIDPVQLGIKNTPLHNGVPMSRGVQFKLPGNQILGLRFSTTWNNTFIANSNNCRRGNSSYNNACEGAIGSTFDPVENIGWTPYLQDDWEHIVGHLDKPPANTNVVRGVAEADFDNGPTVALPIAVWNNPSIDPTTEMGSSPSKSVFGIGSSSDLIKSFLNGNFVPSGFLGLYFGSRSLNCSEDGEMTIGGWDGARVAGPFVNYSMNAFAMNTTCPLRVRITSLKLNNDGGAFELISGDQGIEACVDPFQNAIGFTDALYAIWANVTQHPTEADGPPFTDQTYPLANEHLIDTIDIELEGGYSTTVSHCELVSLERGANLDNIGEYSVVNSSRIMAAISHGPTDLGTDFGVLLGGAFLARTYLRIDYENNQFGLAPAISGSSVSANVHKVCSRDTSVPNKTNDTIPTTSPKPASNSGAGAGLSTDTKATIGGSVAGAVIALVGVYITYKAYRHSQRADEARRKNDAEMLDIGRSRTFSTNSGMSPRPEASNAMSPGTGRTDGEAPSVSPLKLPEARIDCIV
jgi:hypothetical protein